MEQYEALMRDKTYVELPMGRTVAEFLAVKRKRFTQNSMDAYESTLNAFARKFAYHELEQFEGIKGAELVERWLDDEWGKRKASTYNRHLATMRSFFKFQKRRGRIKDNPMELIDPAKEGETERTAFTRDTAQRIIAAQDVVRDRIAMQLMLHYGLRRGGMLAIQFRHFDHVRRELTVFLKGGKVRALPIPEPAFWYELERLILESEAQPHHYLMQARWSNKRSEKAKPDKPMSPHGFHKFWYRCLAKAGVVAEGVTSGEKPHKARHSAGQIILEQTGDLKLVQQTLMHKNISTTADTYVNYDNPALAERLGRVWRTDDE